MATPDTELWEQLSAYLKKRKGWSLVPMSAPGAPATWCYRSKTKITLQASVDRGTVCVYVMEDDREVRFASVAALAAQLEGVRTPAPPPDRAVADGPE